MTSAGRARAAARGRGTLVEPQALPEPEQRRDGLRLVDGQVLVVAVLGRGEAGHEEDGRALEGVDDVRVPRVEEGRLPPGRAGGRSGLRGQEGALPQPTGVFQVFLVFLGFSVNGWPGGAKGSCFCGQRRPR